MNKTRKLRLVLFLVLIVLTISIPNIAPVNAQSTVDEWLYVHTDDNTYTDWSEVGTTPFVDTQDEPTNYGYASSSNDNWGAFLIDDTTGTNTVNSVNLTVYCDSGTEKIDFYIYDLSATVFVVVGSDQQSAGYHYVSFDLITIITTVAEIDAIELYVRSRNVGGFGGQVELDYAVIGVNVDIAGGIDYDKTVNEEIIFDDTNYVNIDWLTSFYEEIIFSDSTYLDIDYIIQFYEELIFSDTYSAFLVLTKLLFEDITFSETSFPFVTWSAILNEVINIYDSTYIDISYIVQLFEELIFSDTYSAIIVLTKILFEGITFYDSTFPSVDWTIILNEIINIDDSVYSAIAYLINLFEEITVYEIVNAGILTVVELFESITFVDIINTFVEFFENTNDGYYIFGTWLRTLGFLIGVAGVVFFASLVIIFWVKEGL